jgi:hypothetical protein
MTIVISKYLSLLTHIRQEREAREREKQEKEKKKKDKSAKEEEVKRTIYFNIVT